MRMLALARQFKYMTPVAVAGKRPISGLRRKFPGTARAVSKKLKATLGHKGKGARFAVGQQGPKFNRRTQEGQDPDL